MRSRAWYLVYTKPRQEEIAVENLDRQGFCTFLPTMSVIRPRSMRDQLANEPLFPRYLFVDLNADTDDWSPIRSTVGVSHLVRFGDQFAKVPDYMIEALRQQCDVSGRLAVQQATIRVGDKVRILRGVAKDCEGIVMARTARERVDLLLTTAAGYSATLRVSEKYLMRVG